MKLADFRKCFIDRDCQAWIGFHPFQRRNYFLNQPLLEGMFLSPQRFQPATNTSLGEVKLPDVTLSATYFSNSGLIEISTDAPLSSMLPRTAARVNA